MLQTPSSFFAPSRLCVPFICQVSFLQHGSAIFPPRQDARLETRPADGYDDSHDINTISIASGSHALHNSFHPTPALRL